MCAEYRYRLKDKDKQKELEKIFPGFGEGLDEAVKEFPDHHLFYVSFKDSDWALELPRDDIEFVTPYDPNKWNSYPEVQPPEGVLMRVEFVFEGIMRRNCSIFENGAWRLTENGKASQTYKITLDDVKRFRPWE